MRADLRILIFTPVLFGLGCQENPYFVTSTTDTTASSTGETSGTSGTVGTGETEDTSSTSGTEGDCENLVDIPLMVDDAFFITSYGANCEQINVDPEYPCDVLNFGGAAGAPIGNIEEERGAYAIRPHFPQMVIEEPWRLQHLSLELVFYTEAVPATLSYVLAKIGQDDVWLSGMGNGAANTVGATWEERLHMPAKEWSGSGMGPIGGSEWICDTKIKFDLRDDQHKPFIMCKDELTGVAQEWLATEDNTHNGLVVYLKSKDYGFWIKSSDNEDAGGAYKPKFMATICM